MTVICPECGGEMRLLATSKYRYHNGLPRRFYGCVNYPECKGSLGAHPNGEPMGFPGDEEVKQWRIKAHKAFEKFCLKWHYRRRRAYGIMKDLMGMTCNQAHIGKFGRAECQRMIEELDSYQKD